MDREKTSLRRELVMSVLQGLEPQNVFHYFEEISSIPRGTFNTKAISDHLRDFGKELGLEVIQDEANNIIIRKPGTKGYEDKDPIILQGHMDMVCEKRPNSDHDFTKDGIELVIGDDGQIRAKETTLGADDGIAVAMIMAVLASNDISHPPIEALITVDEEQGMGGAQALELSLLKGKNLINIDSEEEGIVTAGCAGGFRFEYKLPIVKKELKGDVVSINIHGLRGGHSGQEIHEQRGNAHKMMGRLLDEIAKEAKINVITSAGGSKDNVISLINKTEILVETGKSEKVVELVKEMEETWLQEFMGEEPHLQVDVKVEKEQTVEAFDDKSTRAFIDLLVLIPNGVILYSRKLKGLVETSLNIGVVETRDNEVFGASMVRSSVESEKIQLKGVLVALMNRLGASYEVVGDYPAWQFLEKSHLRDILIKEYEELYKKTPEVTTVHAGLECGLFIGKRPDLDCVSIGPDMGQVHSFNEHLSIESTKRTYDYLLAILKNM